MGQSNPVSPSNSVQHYENFPVASWLCPAHLRGAVRAIYHFARCADDIADEGIAAAHERMASLSRYRTALSRMDEPAAVAALPDAWRPIFADLSRQRAAHRLPTQPLHDLITAFEEDVPNPIHADRQSLLNYCKLSANPVGRLLLHLYGIDDAKSLAHADAVCSALQLANFWQDLSVDLPRGRCYLTEADMQQHALTRQSLAQGDTAASRALVAALVRWTRQLMLEGAPLALNVPGRAGWELRLVVLGGLRILDKIEQQSFNALTMRPTLGPRDALPLVWQACMMRP